MNNLVHNYKKHIQSLDDNYRELLTGNLEFVKSSLKKDRDFFQKLSSGQFPEILWIGCADSRVPANQITATDAGKIFEHL